jgi:hypothetical protein
MLLNFRIGYYTLILSILYTADNNTGLINADWIKSNSIEDLEHWK